ncbi:ATP-binding cassette domain-containing protein [Gloeocapsopsis dulcis]|uniref:ABC transporter ATP-binding protein n=1 Tax=Gloeocapsopsis dulcis AAB1 = 1H9 TaxID=1433147 RepID=A0A6N8G275_9CHRO|nr:ABC transporter ATP-binding protein [Gloeocapsopsis dulcis]MUL38447.1 ABC transporter ATP-binding protein [Gloeocapsopsis dulcis AAB1 = 1H9]WNN89727.1 ABC transporter ATP-binding protein [Gloeocapsopsis dulcis]
MVAAKSQKPPTWALLWHMMLYQPRLCAIDSIIWVFGMGLPIVPGLLIREFFDTLTGNAPLRFSPWTIIILLLAIGFIRIAMIVLGRFTNTQLRFAVSSLLRRNLLDSLFSQPGAQPLFALDNTNKTVSRGEVISFFRDDVEQIEETIAWIGSLPGYGLIVLGSVVVLLSINVQITLFVFLPLIGIAAVVQYAETRLKQYRQASYQATQHVTGLISDLFTAIGTIKVTGAQHDVLNHFRTMNEHRRQTMLRDRVLTAMLESVFQNIGSLGTGGILLLASQSMSAGSALTVGDFALFVYYLSFITSFLDYFGRFMLLCKQSQVSFDRLATLLRDAPIQTLVAHHRLYLSVLGRQPTLPPIKQPKRNQNSHLHELTAFNLTYRYPGTDRGIHGINLKLVRGSLTVITGRIGSGKTTLLRVLLGLLPMEAGAIYWNGSKIDPSPHFFIPPRSAYTPQVPQLLSTTLGENLRLGLTVEEDQLKQAIALAAFEQDLATMPEALDTQIGANGMRLSGGQVQRVAATRMFVRQPELLVFDDLSSALDVETEKILWKRLFAATAWTPTCLVVSHRPTLLQRAERIIVLEDGRVQAEGKWDDLQDFSFLNT